LERPVEVAYRLLRALDVIVREPLESGFPLVVGEIKAACRPCQGFAGGAVEVLADFELTVEGVADCAEVRIQAFARAAVG